jgi:hypothetical protein
MKEVSAAPLFISKTSHYKFFRAYIYIPFLGGWDDLIPACTDTAYNSHAYPSMHKTTNIPYTYFLKANSELVLKVR